MSYVLEVLCQKQVLRAGTSSYIPQILWDVITCPCPWFLSLMYSCSILNGMRGNVAVLLLYFLVHKLAKNFKSTICYVKYPSWILIHVYMELFVDRESCSCEFLSMRIIKLFMWIHVRILSGKFILKWAFQGFDTFTERFYADFPRKKYTNHVVIYFIPW